MAAHLSFHEGRKAAALNSGESLSHVLGEDNNLHATPSTFLYTPSALGIRLNGNTGKVVLERRIGETREMTGCYITDTQNFKHFYPTCIVGLINVGVPFNQGEAWEK